MKAVFFKAVFFKGVCFKAVRMAFAGLLIGPGIAVPFVLAAIMFDPTFRHAALEVPEAARWVW